MEENLQYRRNNDPEMERLADDLSRGAKKLILLALIAIAIIALLLLL